MFDLLDWLFGKQDHDDVAQSIRSKVNGYQEVYNRAVRLYEDLVPNLHQQLHPHFLRLLNIPGGSAEQAIEQHKEDFLGLDGTVEQWLESLPSTSEVSAQLEARIHAIAPSLSDPDQIQLGNRMVAHYGHAEWAPIHLTESQRFEHMYVVGKTGAGKTNTLTYLILQDIHAGRGISVMAPDKQLFEQELLPRIPESRINDVIYIDPRDDVLPVSINPLMRAQGENMALKVDDTYTILRRAAGEDLGVVMQTVLRNAIYALIERARSTLFDLERLLDLSDPSLREEIIHTTKDERTRRYWAETFMQLPNIKNSVMYLLNRFEQLLRPPVSNVLCGVKNPLNLRRAMDQGKIIFFNLSSGTLGESTSGILGQFIASSIQQAAMSRENVAPKDRVAHTVFIDEFDSYTRQSERSYSEILARARKYRLGLVLAHQQTSQLSSDMLHEIVGNVGTMVVFKVSHRDAQFFKNELVNLKDPYGNVIRDADVWREVVRVMQTQRKGRGYARIDTKSYLIQVPLVESQKDFDRAARVKEESQLTYGHPPFSPERPRNAPEAPSTTKNGADVLQGNQEQSEAASASHNNPSPPESRVHDDLAFWERDDM